MQGVVGEARYLRLPVYAPFLQLKLFKIIILKPINGIFVVTGLKASTRMIGNWIAENSSSTDKAAILM